MHSFTSAAFAATMTLFTCAFPSPAPSCPDSPENPAAPELGRVTWSRDLEASLAGSRQCGKPVFLLFQEVPGCQGCKDFGASPLSHPLLVEAIEDEFIPVVIHNNKPGKDEEVLKHYQEPAWNYPVVRFLNSAGEDLILRQDNVFTVQGIASRMIESLEAAHREVPVHLKIALLESKSEIDRRSPKARSENFATFAMHCFWDGEAKLGIIEGVITTRAGFLDGQEIVDVVYDPSMITYEELVKAAESVECATNVYVHSDEQVVAARAVLGERAKPAKGKTRAAPESDQKYALAHSELKWLPLTPMQATKVNAALRLGKDPNQWLSPRQVAMRGEIARALQHNPKALDGLTRPEAINDLLAYADQLQARLASPR